MFSPSGRLSHFSGKRRIEDVLSRYINLPDHDRESVVQNREEFQQEINNLQHQLQMAEEQLRIFEPDLRSLRTTDELESCEKHLTDALDRVTQRKEGATSFGNEVIHCWPETAANQGVKDHNTNQIFTGPHTSCFPLRNHSSTTVYDALSHTNGVNGETHTHSIEGCQISDPGDDSFPQWHHSAGLFTALMQSENPFSLTKNEMHSPNIETMSVHQPVEASSAVCQQVPLSEEGANYETNLP
ncbi:unnamed protein product [Ilex paraguariensis]|uniref:Uncharacterized protein n=1 Tax=Ilex paraguariensis TaxID=185542 RepID=A0ABC8UXI2_9AQUA